MWNIEETRRRAREYYLGCLRYPRGCPKHPNKELVLKAMSIVDDVYTLINKHDDYSGETINGYYNSLVELIYKSLDS